MARPVAGHSERVKIGFVPWPGPLRGSIDQVLKDDTCHGDTRVSTVGVGIEPWKCRSRQVPSRATATHVRRNASFTNWLSLSVLEPDGADDDEDDDVWLTEHRDHVVQAPSNCARPAENPCNILIALRPIEALLRRPDHHELMVE